MPSLLLLQRFAAAGTETVPLAGSTQSLATTDVLLHQYSFQIYGGHERHRRGGGRAVWVIHGSAQWLVLGSIHLLSMKDGASRGRLLLLTSCVQITKILLGLVSPLLRSVLRAQGHKHQGLAANTLIVRNLNYY